MKRYQTKSGVLFLDNDFVKFRQGISVISTHNGSETCLLRHLTNGKRALKHCCTNKKENIIVKKQTRLNRWKT